MTRTRRLVVTVVTLVMAFLVGYALRSGFDSTSSDPQAVFEK
jgi:hypothetical protein